MPLSLREPRFDGWRDDSTLAQMDQPEKLGRRDPVELVGLRSDDSAAWLKYSGIKSLGGRLEVAVRQPPKSADMWPLGIRLGRLPDDTPPAPVNVPTTRAGAESRKW